MARTPRPAWGVWVGERSAQAAGLLLFALPIAAALPLALAPALDVAAWMSLWADPQLPRAIGASLFSALGSTLVALVLAMLLTTALHGSRAWGWLQQALAPMLALPHAAFAIGLAWLVAPSGALARLIAPVALWDSPPQWETVNDRHALLLSAVLVLKELPFLLWNLAALLARPEVASELRAQQSLGRSLGYSPQTLWWRVGWPVWLPRLAWPLLAVLAYSLTVVDLALIVGPGSPPTLAALAYADLMDGNPQRNARGAAAALLLAALLAALVLAVRLLWPVLLRLWTRRATRGDRPLRQATASVNTTASAPVRLIAAAVVASYGLATLALLLLSFAGVYTFPNWLPQQFSPDAWLRVAEQSGTLVLTAALALAASVLGLVLVVAWFEATPQRWDAIVTPLVLAPLVLPPLLLMSGLYLGALRLRLDGSLAGLLWVHLLVVLPYSFITLRPAWRGFDPRLQHTALALGRSRRAFWLGVKWPLLARPIAAALAVGFAVSVAQFLATQFIGAGRFATVTTEAVLLASGGQRTVAAAFALMQALLPLLAFALAARVGR